MALGFEHLPSLVMEKVLDFLDLPSAWRLGTTCKYLHRVILEEDKYWRRRARQTLRIQLVPSESPGEVGVRLDSDQDRALIGDPSLNGHAELLKIFLLKPAFAAALPHHTKSKGRISDLFGLLQSLSLWEDLVHRGEDCLVDAAVSHCKLALFGPGIESPRTKHLVHRIVQAHDSSLNAVDFVAGLPGGIGSGVRVKFEKGRVFDLVCLYTNSGRLREDYEGVERLLARNNRMLTRNADAEEEEMEWLHDNVLRVLPTLDVLLFAIDANSVPLDLGDPQHPQIKYIKRELDIMIRASSKHVPVVVLCCSDTASQPTSDRPNYDVIGLSKALCMGQLQRPWSIFEVNIRDMKGFVNALRWIFYRREKEKNQLRYHKEIANCSSSELQERLRSLW